MSSIDPKTLETLQDGVIRAVQVQDYPQARRLIELAVADAASSNHYRQLHDQQVAANKALEEKIKELQVPPLTRGLILGPSPDDKKNVIIGSGGQRFEVRIAADVDLTPDKLTPGWEAWLNEDRQIIKARAPASSGEPAEVLAILDDGRLEVQGHGTETMIVDRLSNLGGDGLRLGDRVRIDPQLAIALEKLPQQENKDLELEAVPDVTYADVGGLDEHIEQIREAIELPYLYHNLFRQYQLRRPKGILLYGPPGCGKTMIAKAIANSLTTEISRNLRDIAESLGVLLRLSRDEIPAEELATVAEGWRSQVRRLAGERTTESDGLTREVLAAEVERFLGTRGADPTHLETAYQRATERLKDPAQAYFMSIKGPELLNKYVGETELSIRKLFLQAKRKASPSTPVIMFFDEIEALFRRRGSRVSSDMESTVVPQFLSEMDGVEALTDVIIIGATNRQDLLDPAILRPGRLDAKIKIERPGPAAARSIFSKYLVADLPIAAHEAEAAGSAAQAIERMVCRAVELLFADGSAYKVAGKRPEDLKTLRIKDFLSGAMIENIVSRAKRRAVKRQIDRGENGIIWQDLADSIREEFDQNKDQLVASTLNVSEEGLTIELVLGVTDGKPAVSPWLRPIERPWLPRRRAA